MLDEEGNNHFSWLAGMEVYMDYQEVSQVAKGNELTPPSSMDEDTAPFLKWGRKDRLAKAQIARNVPLSLLSQFDRMSSATLLAGLNERFTLDKDIRQNVAHHHLRNKTIGINERMSTHISELRNCGLLSYFWEVNSLIQIGEEQSYTLYATTGSCA